MEITIEGIVGFYFLFLVLLSIQLWWFPIIYMLTSFIKRKAIRFGAFFAIIALLIAVYCIVDWNVFWKNRSSFYGTFEGTPLLYSSLFFMQIIILIGIIGSSMVVLGYEIKKMLQKKSKASPP